MMFTRIPIPFLEKPENTTHKIVSNNCGLVSIQDIARCYEDTWVEVYFSYMKIINGRTILFCFQVSPIEYFPQNDWHQPLNFGSISAMQTATKPAK